MKNLKTDYIIFSVVILLVAFGVAINVNKQLSIDESKLPDKVEQSEGFQRWITNLKNKGLEQVDADEFRLLEKNEIYNTKWLKVYSADDMQKVEELEKYFDELRETKKVIYSPSEKLLIDYRDIERLGYEPNEVHFYGIKEDKILDARILDCSVRANCYFDRAYFLSNDLFVISEFSRNIDKKDKETPLCPITEECEYTIKIHLIDLINNSRLVYESQPFNIVFSTFKPEL